MLYCKNCGDFFEEDELKKVEIIAREREVQEEYDYFCPYCSSGYETYIIEGYTCKLCGDQFTEDEIDRRFGEVCYNCRKIIDEDFLLKYNSAIDNAKHLCVDLKEKKDIECIYSKILDFAYEVNECINSFEEFINNLRIEYEKRNNV